MGGASWDVIVVGQGLAGTTLAWCLQEAGQRVLVLDASEPATSSSIAAGLITPVAGQRLVKDPRYEEFLSAARSLYRTVEERTACRFFHDRTSLRLFMSAEERSRWSKRRKNPDYLSLVVDPQPESLIDPELCDAGHGGVALRAAQLDVAAFLAASRSALQVETVKLDWAEDVEFNTDIVKAGSHEARFLISCEGHQAAQNPYFPDVPFKSVKGDILTLKFHRPLPALNIHRDIWIAQTENADVFKVGATYDRSSLDLEPDPSARDWIEERLKAFVHAPYSVIDHQSAVRPVLQVDKVLVGLRPDTARLGFFNGLGSKGALQAPWFAERLTRFLTDRTPLSGDMNIANHVNS